MKVTFELAGELRPTSLEGPGNIPPPPHSEQALYRPAYLTSPFYDPYSQQQERPRVPQQWIRGVFRDETQPTNEAIASLEERLGQAHTDALTGLSKREKFIEELDQYIKKQPGNVMLLFLDLDRLKEINDTHKDKHKAGDDLLRRTGTRIRQSDIVKHGCRYGGDEICVIVHGEAHATANESLPDGERRTPHKIESENMFSIIERLRNELVSDGIEVSIGGAIHIEGESAESLISRADGAMYIDKEARKKARRARQLGLLTINQRTTIHDMAATLRSVEILPDELPDLLKAVEEDV